MENIKEEVLEQVDNIIDYQFNTIWYAEDFLSGYMKAKGIENVENITEEQWIEFESKMDEPGFLSGFRETIIEDINERISMLF